MRLTCANTGSDGNCYVLQSEMSMLVLDAGVNWNSMRTACRYHVELMDAVLLTHIHSDHVNASAIKELRRNGIPVYGNKTASEKFPEVTRLRQKHSIRIKSWKVTAFAVPHTNSDSTECENYAYIIEKNGERLLYMTDWMYCPYNLHAFNVNHFLIAVNYTDLGEEDDSAKRHHVLHGHSSLETAREFIKTSMTDKCKTVIACHLSARNADAEKILTELRDTAPNANVWIAKKGVSYELS